MNSETIAKLTELLKQAVPETYYILNYSEPITYPYLTFRVTLSNNRRYNSKIYYVDFDIFDDQGGDDSRIEDAVGALTDLVDDPQGYQLTDDLLIRFDGLTAHYLPTNSDTLQRRTGQIIVRVDWRR